MAFMSCLQKQNTNKVTGRYGTAKLPSLLPEMQTGNSNQCETTEYHSYQRARRTDAEPITHKVILLVVIGFFMSLRHQKQTQV
jgi:hypothetical protein